MAANDRLVKGTSRGVIYIVVGTLAALCIIYVITLAGILISGAQVDREAMKAFEYAGVYVLGAFTGMLMNTRTLAETPKDTKETTEVVVRREREPDEEPHG